jgi:hypothetical protein
MRFRYVAGLVLSSLISVSCQIVTEAQPTTGEPVDTPTPPPKTPTPKNKPSATATATVQATPAATPTPTPNVVATQSPVQTCPDSAPALDRVNGSATCAPFVKVAPGNCGVDSTWWFDCSDYYFMNAVYQYIGGGNPWVFVGADRPDVKCYVPDRTYAIGELARICSTGGARTCDPDHMQNPAMIACCQNHVWRLDERRVVVTASDASGTPLQVNRAVMGNPSFSEIVVEHPGEVLTVTYCLPPPPLVDADCGTVFPSSGPGCSTKTFIP